MSISTFVLSPPGTAQNTITRFMGLVVGFEGTP
jgi:hypothetical protein